MNQFEICELKGRALFKSFLDQIGATEQQPTKDKFDPADYYFTFKGEKYVVEIKCRDIQYQHYDTHLMESIKLQKLLIAKNDNHCDVALYVNFFGNDTAYLYNATDIINSAEQENIYCNKTTAINTGKIKKSTLMIPTSVARILIRKDGKWQNGDSNNK